MLRLLGSFILWVTSPPHSGWMEHHICWAQHEFWLTFCPIIYRVKVRSSGPRQKTSDMRMSVYFSILVRGFLAACWDSQVTKNTFFYWENALNVKWNVCYYEKNFLTLSENFFRQCQKIFLIIKHFSLPIWAFSQYKRCSLPTSQLFHPSITCVKSKAVK